MIPPTEATTAMMIVVVFPRLDVELLLLDGEEVGDGEDVDVWCFEEEGVDDDRDNDEDMMVWEGS
jgi:hypothetical protein